MKGKRINITPSKELCRRLDFSSSDDEISLEYKTYNSDVFSHLHKSSAFANAKWTSLCWNNTIKTPASKSTSCKRKLVDEESEALQLALDKVSTFAPVNGRRKLSFSNSVQPPLSTSTTTEHSFVFAREHSTEDTSSSSTLSKNLERSIQSDLTSKLIFVDYNTLNW